MHEQILQPGEFFIPEPLGKPTEKLGETIEKIKFYRKQGYSIYNSIVQAAKDCDYYANNIDNKIDMIIHKGFSYYWKSRNLPNNAILLPDKDRETCLQCIKSIEKNKKINNKLHPIDIFGDPIKSFNEDAFFADFVVVINNKAVIIPFKMKIDNWTIDTENKILTLNDLKTSRKCCKYFMHPEFGSWKTFNYNRQFGAYSYILKSFCEKEYGFNEEWKFEANVFVVETTGEHRSECFTVPNFEIEEGFQEFENLMKMVGYYTIFGYEEEVEFI